MLSIGLLGVFRIEGVESHNWTELGPAGRGLASFLFTYPGRSHRREHLADLFWPNLDYEHARRALNSAVWRLRRLLAQHPQSAGGQNLKTIGCETVLEEAPWLDIDAAALLEASNLVQKQPAALQDQAVLNRVITVLHRYQGPFLDGDEGDWILDEREHLHSLFLRATTLVVCRLGATEIYDEAIRLTRRALRFDPYREELVRTLLILLALDERRFEAIQFYDNWSKSLKKEIEIGPLPATRMLVDEIKALQSPESFQALKSKLANYSVKALRF